MRKRLTTIVVAAAAVAPLCVSPPANAAPVSGGHGKLVAYILRNEATGRCLDDSFAYGLRSYPCNNTAYQSWQAIPGTFPAQGSWKNYSTGRCIDDSFDYGLRAFDCNGLSYQLWGRYGTQVGGRTWLQNQATTGCIDDSFDYGLRSYGCNNSDWQNWLIEE